MRFEPECPLSQIVKDVPHVAFEVDNLLDAIEGKKVIIKPNSPSDSLQVASIEENAAPVELMQSNIR